MKSIYLFSIIFVLGTNQVFAEDSIDLSLSPYHCHYYDNSYIQGIIFGIRIGYLKNTENSKYGIRLGYDLSTNPFHFSMEAVLTKHK